MIEVERVTLEQRLLCEQLNLQSKGQKYLFTFDHSRAGIASAITRNLELRRAPVDQLPAAPVAAS